MTIFYGQCSSGSGGWCCPDEVCKGRMWMQEDGMMRYDFVQKQNHKRKRCQHRSVFFYSLPTVLFCQQKGGIASSPCIPTKKINIKRENQYIDVQCPLIPNRHSHNVHLPHLAHTSMGSCITTSIRLSTIITAAIHSPYTGPSLTPLCARVRPPYLSTIIESRRGGFIHYGRYRVTLVDGGGAERHY